MKATVEQAIAKANEMAYSDYRIHAGIERKAVSKIWEKDGIKRAYIRIDCYTLSGNYKGNYKCGYIDLLTDEYVSTDKDDVSLF